MLVGRMVRWLAGAKNKNLHSFDEELSELNKGSGKMNGVCSFYFSEYDSPSGYYGRLETDGTKVPVKCPTRKSHGDQYFRVTILPGQHLLLEHYDLDGHGEDEREVVLVQAPSDQAQFEEFCRKAEVAGQAVYDRILGYKRGPRFGGGPYDYTGDFGGKWLDKFVLRRWKDEDRPATLAEALHRVAS